MNDMNFSWPQERVMAKAKLINLDAMIKREDLNTLEGAAQVDSGAGGVPVAELAKGRLHYSLLRKPDFQRETNDWDIDNVVAFIKSFRDGHLIPALILWSSQNGYSFVIDGAHRLSALIAWVNDDYGDREISRSFFDHKIPAAQEKNAKECRDRVAQEVGTYRDISSGLTDDNPAPERIKWAANISRSLATQQVPGDADMAETSFLAINQRAVQIKDPEKYMILGRKKAHVIAARALVRSATGHKYWSKFSADMQLQIEKKAADIYGKLFEPETADFGRTIEMPVAGHPYSANALRMALELICHTNKIKTSRDLKEIQDDETGEITLNHLDGTYRVIKYISGDGPASLGLHPAVYFWGSTGSHLPSSVLAVTSFIKDLIDRKGLIDFSMHRASIEEFIVGRGTIVKHILGTQGGWAKSVPKLIEMYELISTGFCAGKSDDDVESDISNHASFAGLAAHLEVGGAQNKKISRETKNSVRRRELLKSAQRCAICHARLPSSSFSNDHIIRAEDGGHGSPSNIQLTHPFCNSGLKENLVSRGLSLPEKPEFLKLG